MKNRTVFLSLFLLIAAASLAACAGPGVLTQTKPPAPEALLRLSPAELSDLLDSSDPDSLAGALQNSLNYYSKLSPETSVSFGAKVYPVSEVSRSLSDLHDFLLTNPSSGLLGEYVREHFDVYVSTGHDGSKTALFTGYYTPELPASAEYDESYRYPLYSLPEDLVTADLGLFGSRYKGEKITGMVKDGKLVPYYSRKEIEAGTLAGRGLEIAWCKDPVDVFFMQVQGSGVLALPDGTRVHANYSGQNGRPYRSIGKMLVEEGKADISSMSMPWLKDYLRSHPDEEKDILDYNESYVFFTLSDTGPYGSIGQPVTAGRTVAADSRVFPPGALAYIETEVPVFSETGEIKGWEPYRRFVVNQDTGGAISGPGRVDIYFGPGETAELLAGHMRREGRLYFLAPRRQPQP